MNKESTHHVKLTDRAIRKGETITDLVIRLSAIDGVDILFPKGNTLCNADSHHAVQIHYEGFNTQINTYLGEYANNVSIQNKGEMSEEDRRAAFLLDQAFAQRRGYS